MTCRQPFSFVHGSTAMNTLVRFGVQHAVLVPVAVVLVPRPRAADLRVLQDHLRVVVVHLAAEQLLAAPHHPLAAGEHAVDAVAGVVPERQPHDAALAVGAAEGALVEFVVLLRGAVEEVDFLARRRSPRAR